MKVSTRLLLLLRKVVSDFFGRITTDGDRRITADGDKRITAGE